MSTAEVWDCALGVMRPLAKDEWELESHWTGLLEVHGVAMPGHQWLFVVPKYKLDASCSGSHNSSPAMKVRP